MTPLPNLTLTLSASALDAATLPPGAVRERGAGGAASAFARELRQQQDSANRPPQRNEHDKPPAEADGAPPPATETAAQRQRAADARARGKAGAAGDRPHATHADGPAKGGGTEGRDGTAPAEASKDADTEAGRADAPPAATASGGPNPAVPLPGATPTDAGPCGPAGAAAGDPGAALADGASALPAPGADPKALAASAHARAGALPAGASPADAAHGAGAATPDALTALAAPTEPVGTAAATSTPAFADVLAAAGGAPAGGPSRNEALPGDAAPAQPPLAGEIDADVGSPGFAPALGARLTLLARDGVQEARLALHPADLGPITVQIAVEGAAAHIHFLAEQAATRSAIESSLPALAAALREGGLTLAGGGVLQQGQGGQGRGDGGDSGGQPGGGRGAGRGGAGADESGLGVQQVAARRTGTPRGVVDLYA